MKRLSLVRKAHRKPQRKPLQRSPMSRGLTGKLSGQPRQRLKKPAKRSVTGCDAEHDHRLGMTREEADAGTAIAIADTQRTPGRQQ